MIITKDELLKTMKTLMAEAKQHASPEYREGYSDGVFDLFNNLNKQIDTCPPAKKMV